MKTKSITKIVSIAAALIVISITGCRKENVTPNQPVNSQLNAPGSKGAVNSVKLMNIATTELNNALFQSANTNPKKGSAGNGEKSYIDMKSSCAIITYDTVNKPGIETIDYGTGCVGNDGNTRTGQIVMTFDTLDFRVPANTYHIAFSNFTFNGTPLAGSEVIHNNGLNGNNNMTFSVNDNFQFNSASDLADSEQSTHLYVWLAGQNSNPLSNLQFSITGNTTMYYQNSTSATSTITSPLLRNYNTESCNYYVQGTETIQYPSQPLETIDYGNGTCTGTETVTINGQTTTQPQ